MVGLANARANYQAVSQDIHIWFMVIIILTTKQHEIHHPIHSFEVWLQWSSMCVIIERLCALTIKTIPLYFLNIIMPTYRLSAV